MKFNEYSKFLAVALFGITSCLAQQVYATELDRDGRDNKREWVATWGASQAETGISLAWLRAPNATNPELTPRSFNNQTIRMIVHTSLKGNDIRVRLTNAYPTVVNYNPAACPCDSNNQFVTINEAHVAIRGANAAIIANTDRTLKFNGKKSVIIPPNGEVISDPISLNVPFQSDLAITMHILPTAPAAASVIFAARHPLALQTSYIAGTTGNFTNNVDGVPFTIPTNQCYLASAVEVKSKKSAIVAFGASITDGYSADSSTLNTNTRYTNFLAQRLHDADNQMGVINAGINGNMFYYDTPIVSIPDPFFPGGYNGIVSPSGQSALARFNRDVLDVAGVEYVILQGTLNDIVFSFPQQGLTLNAYPATYDQYVFAYKQMIEQAHVRGIKIYGATITPIGGSDTDRPEVEAMRQSLNAWIRSCNDFDAVIDFDAALADPSNPTKLRPEYDSGDHVHPNAYGYEAMADAIDLDLF